VGPTTTGPRRRRRRSEAREETERDGRLELHCCGEERDSPGMSVPSVGITKWRCRCSIRWRRYMTVLFCKMQMQMMIQ
jgi:hypothetical protein